MKLPWRFLLLLSLANGTLASKVKIFVLAGQSNMVGFASISHLRELVRQDFEYRQYLDPATDDFRVLHDVRIAFNDKKGTRIQDLAVGLGLNATTFGPEVGFGWTMNDAKSGDSILILKHAADGSSLAYNWRPPSASDTGKADTKIMGGPRYRSMMTMVQNATLNLEAYFPGQGKDGYDIVGFVWLQGWFDAYVDSMREEYMENLKHLVEDVRLSFGNPDLPVLIGELGQGGDPVYIPQIKAMRRIQKAVADSFDSNVVFVRTSPYVVSGLETFNGLHHYDGRADTMIHIGNAFGREMLKLLPSTESHRWIDRSRTAQDELD